MKDIRVIFTRAARALRELLLILQGYRCYTVYCMGVRAVTLSDGREGYAYDGLLFECVRKDADAAVRDTMRDICGSKVFLGCRDFKIVDIQRGFDVLFCSPDDALVSIGHSLAGEVFTDTGLYDEATAETVLTLCGPWSVPDQV